MTADAMTRLQARTGVPSRLTSSSTKRASPLKHDRYPQQSRLPPSQQIIKTKPDKGCSAVRPSKQADRRSNAHVIESVAQNHECSRERQASIDGNRTREGHQKCGDRRPKASESTAHSDVTSTHARTTKYKLGTSSTPCLEKRFNWWTNEKNTVHAKAKLAENFVHLQGNFSYAREDGLRNLKAVLSEPTEVGKRILALQDIDTYNIVQHLHVSIFERWENSSGPKHQNCRVSVAELVLSLELIEGAVLLHPDSREYVNIELMSSFIRGVKFMPEAASAHLHKHGLAVLVATMINCSLTQFKRFKAEDGIESVANSVSYTGPIEREIRLHAWELITIMNNEQSDLNTRIAMRRILEKQFGRPMIESAVRYVQFYM